MSVGKVVKSLFEISLIVRCARGGEGEVGERQAVLQYNAVTSEVNSTTRGNQITRYSAGRWFIVGNMVSLAKHVIMHTIEVWTDTGSS